MSILASTPTGNALAVFKYQKKNPCLGYYYNKRNQARIKGIPFNLVFKEIEWPRVCPVLGIPLVYHRNRDGKRGPRDDSPSFDRINPNQGYIVGNVRIISNRANTIKSNATAAELERVWKYVKGELN